METKKIKECKSYIIKDGGEKRLYLDIKYNKQRKVISHKTFYKDNSTKISEFKYNDNGKLLNRTTEKFDCNNNKEYRKEETNIYNTQQLLTSIIKDGQTVFEYKYDDRGNLIYEKSTTDHIDMETTYEYDNNNHIIYTKSNTSEVFNKYDDNGNLIHAKSIYVEGNNTTAPSTVEINYKYNDNGNIISSESVNETNGNIYKSFQKYEYDENNNVIYSNEDELETWYTYDKNNNVISAISTSGHCTLYKYNEAGMTTEYLDIYQDRIYKEEYEYDEYNRNVYYKNNKHGERIIKYDEYGNTIHLINKPSNTEYIYEYDYYEDKEK